MRRLRDSLVLAHEELGGALGALDDARVLLAVGDADGALKAVTEFLSAQDEPEPSPEHVQEVRERWGVPSPTSDD